jgi:hypothetical protein
MQTKHTDPVKLSYAYRDEANYRRSGEVVLSNPEGLSLEEAARRLSAAMPDEQYFIARQVRVPDQFFWPAKLEGSDHAWHTFEGLERVEAEPNDMHGRCLAQLVAEVEAAARAGWETQGPHGAPWEGEIVRVMGCTGVVLKVYVGAGGAWAARIHFVKNGFQRQGPELHTSETLAGQFEPSSLKDLLAERGQRQADIDQRLYGVLAAAGAAAAD